MSQQKYYPQLNSKISFPEMEKEMIAYWEEQKIFQKSIEIRKEAEEFVFYDGPPFANGLPHYGHIMISYVKDTIARFQTMNGKRVERRLGWDCHGLPAEMAAEKELNVSGHKAIEEFGIQKFNDFCRPIFEMQAKLEQESKKLVVLRNSLLPRLMRGEIDITVIDA